MNRHGLTGPQDNIKRPFSRWHDRGFLGERAVIRTVSSDRRGAPGHAAAIGFRIALEPVKSCRGQDDLALKAPGVAVDERHQQLVFQQRQLRAHRQVEPIRRKLGCEMDLREVARRAHDARTKVSQAVVCRGLPTGPFIFCLDSRIVSASSNRGGKRPRVIEISGMSHKEHVVRMSTAASQAPLRPVCRPYRHALP